MTSSCVLGLSGPVDLVDGRTNVDMLRFEAKPFSLFVLLDCLHRTIIFAQNLLHPSQLEGDGLSI